MTAIRSLKDLQELKEKVREKKATDARLGKVQVIVSLGSCGIAAGALDTLKAIQAQIQRDRLENITVSQTGCIGLCEKEPIVEIIAGEKEKVTYGKVTPEAASRILTEHVLGGKVVEELKYE
jgi:NADP-reducing hydrogenase subunit HndB